MQFVMKKLNLIFVWAILLSAVLFNACDDNNATPNPPSVTVETTTNEVISGSSAEVVFKVSTPGGYLSASVNATGGTAIIMSEPAVDAKSGEVVVKFEAGSAVGAGTLELSVLDKEQQQQKALAVFTVAEKKTVFEVSSNITENTTWETGNTYILKSRVAVVDGVTLTIEPGVVVKGEAGTGANATALIIARGAKLMAEGTAQQPIIFTSVADQIAPGEVASPNLDPTLNGLWGGLIVLGKAHISAKGNVESYQIEGIPASDPNGLYGGTDDADNSGVLRYISIRHGGANIGEGNEINGLTLGGVGSGTVIENIEIVSNQDDGIEFFGGTVKVKNVVVWNTGDDAIDTDQSFSGEVDNIVIINPGDECFELDGPEGSYQGAGHTLKNITAVVGNASGLVDFDANTDVNLINALFKGLTYSADNKQDVEEYDAYVANTLGFACSNWQVILPEGVAVTDVFKGGSDAITTVVTTPTVGANLSVFSNWSWAAVAGEVK